MFSTAVEVVLHIAFREAVSRRHAYLTLEHLLYALAHDPDGERILGACGVDLGALRRNLSKYLDDSIEQVARGQEREPEQTVAFRRVLQSAILQLINPIPPCPGRSSFYVARPLNLSQVALSLIRPSGKFARRSSCLISRKLPTRTGSLNALFLQLHI